MASEQGKVKFKKHCFSEANYHLLEVKRVWQGFFVTLFFTFRHLSHKEKYTKRFVIGQKISYGLLFLP